MIVLPSHLHLFKFLGKDPDAEKDESRRRRGWQRMRWLESITNPMDINPSNFGR